MKTLARKDPWDDIVSGLYYDSLKEKMDDYDFMFSAKLCSETMEFVPSIRQILDNGPKTLDKTHNQPKAIEYTEVKEFDRDEIKRDYDDAPSDMAMTIIESLDEFPNCSRLAHIQEKNSVRVWLGKNFGHSGFSSITGTYEKDGAISKIADMFSIPYSYAEKWINLDLNGKFNHLKG